LTGTKPPVANVVVLIRNSERKDEALLVLSNSGPNQVSLASVPMPKRLFTYSSLKALKPPAPPVRPTEFNRDMPEALAAPAPMSRASRPMHRMLNFKSHTSLGCQYPGYYLALGL
jgi:hypothetical protein